MAINISLQYNGGYSPDIILFDPRLLPSGNPFKCHENISYLQPIKQQFYTRSGKSLRTCNT